MTDEELKKVQLNPGEAQKEALAIFTEFLRANPDCVKKLRGDEDAKEMGRILGVTYLSLIKTLRKD